MFKKISLFFFFYFAIVSVYVIFLPKILASIGYTSFQIGAIFSAAPLVRFVLPFILKRYFQVNKKLLYVSLANLILTGILFYICINSFYAFLLINVLFGASMGVILPFIESFSMEYLHKQRYGKARLFGSVGFILVSLVLANYLKDPYMGLHFLLANMLLTVFCSVWIVHKNRTFSPPKTDTKSSFNLLAYPRFWISIFLIQVSFGAFYNFFTIYETSFGVSLKMVSWMWTLGVICEILFFYFQAPILKRYSSLGIIKFSAFITAIRWFLLFYFPHSLYLTFLSQSLHAISFALLHTAAFSYLHTIYKDTKLASQFYYGISYGLGGFIGSLLSGMTYGVYVYLVSSITALMAFFICKR